MPWQHAWRHPNKGLQMNRKPIPLFILPLLFILVFSSACTQTPQPPFKVASNAWVGYKPLYLARNLGLYDDNRIKLIEMPSATDVFDLLHEGTVDAAAITLDEALSEIANGAELSIVLAFDFSNGADALLTQTDIKTLKGLRGKRIGVETSAVGAILVHSALKKAGLRPDEVDIIHLNADVHIKAFENKRVDAVTTFEPTKSALLALGANSVFDSSEIPGLIVDVLAVRNEALRSQAANIQLLIDGYFSALTHMQKQQSAKTTQGAASPKDALMVSDDGLYFLTRADNKKFLTGSPSQLQTRATELLELMNASNLLRKPVPLDGLANPIFVSGSQP